MLTRWHRNQVFWLAEITREYEAANAAYTVESTLAWKEGLTTPLATVNRRQEAWLKKHMHERTVRDMERDLWPLIVANARQARIESRA